MMSHEWADGDLGLNKTKLDLESGVLGSGANSGSSRRIAVLLQPT